MSGSASDWKMATLTAGTLLLVLGGIYYPALRELVLDWSTDPNYSHGFLIPLISSYFLWQKRNSILGAAFSPSTVGLAVLGAGLLLYVIGDLAAERFTVRVSLLISFAGILLTVFGRDLFRRVFFPYAYLFFMIPLPYLLYDAVAFPLKQLVAKYSVAVLQFFSVPVYREGNIIQLPETTLEVADACSGIRSMMSLLALAVAFAAVSLRRRGRRLFLVLLAVPIAMIANGARVVGTGILARYFGPSVAEGFFHEFAGLVIFGVSVSFLLVTGAALRVGEKRES